jgi:Flp pilus assembly protein TadG
MTARRSIYRRFTASTHGVAAIEFATIMPVLLLLFLASVDAGRAIAVYMKVRSATFTLDAIANQYTTIHDTDMQQILGATSVVFAPYSSSPVVVVISELSISAAGKVTVTWSDTLHGVARTVGSSVNIPATLVTPSTTLIFGEVSYKYAPLFGYFSTGAITLSDNLYVTPRSVASITRSSP